MAIHMKTHRALFLLFLGFGGFAFGRSSVLLCLGFAIGLGLSDLAGDGPRATPARAPVARLPVSPLTFFLIGRPRDFDDDRAVIELLLVENLDGLLSCFGCGECNEPIARGPISAHYNLGGDAVAIGA